MSDTQKEIDYLVNSFTITLARLAADAETPEARTSAIAALSREQLRQRMVACTSCALHTTGGRVALEGSTQPVLFVGEAPEAEDDAVSRPFQSKAGALFRNLCAEAGFPSPQLTTTIGCRPPVSDWNQAQAVGAPAACRPHLTEKLRLSTAWVIVAVGAKAYEQLTGSTASIGSIRMKPTWRDGRIIMGTYHPAYVLRRSDAVAQVREDLAHVARIVAGDLPPLTEVPASLLDQFAGKGDEKSRDHLASRGWLLVYSNLFGEQCVVVRDEKSHSKVPAALVDLPTWTVAELVRVEKEMRAGRFGWEAMRHIQAVKRVFPGTEVMR